MEIGFFLKKSVSYFVEPFGMVIALLVIGLYFLLRDKKGLSKLFLSLGLSLLLLYSYVPFSNFLIVKLENQYPKYNYKHDIKYIHVLGNGHNTDEEQPLSSQINTTSMQRDIEGILIHLSSKNTKIIFTGYEGSTNITNAQMNANFAMALGVEKDNIIINGKPKDTKEEALFTKSIVGDASFVLVTSATHMPRSMMLFESLGLNPIAAPTNYHKGKFNGYFMLPSLGSFYRSQIAVHEYLGMAWNKLKSSI